MDSIDFKKIRLIVFDVDGTLAETDDYYVERTGILINKVFPFIKTESIGKAVRPAIMFSETVLHGIYRGLDLIGLDKLFSMIHSKFSVKENYKYRQVDGIRETLKILSNSFQIGIITSGSRKSTGAFIEKFDLQDLISFVISAEDCRYIKPHPMPLLKMAEVAGIPIENCLMVGDTGFDIVCAKRAGAYSAAVRTGFDSVFYLKLFHADILLDSVNDLPAIIPGCGQENTKSEQTAD